MEKLYFMLTSYTGGNMAARFFVNGLRVSRARFEAIREAAHGPGGRMDCFHTSGRALEGGRTRRRNDSSATVPGGFDVFNGEAQ